MKENIEEDIIALEQYLNAIDTFGTVSQMCPTAECVNNPYEHIKKILSDHKRISKENEELKTLIAHKNGYTQQLEQDLYENASNCVMPKQKIKDKIEELNKKEKQELKGTKGQDRYYIKQQYMYKKNVLEELLEKEN